MQLNIFLIQGAETIEELTCSLTSFSYRGRKLLKSQQQLNIFLIRGAETNEESTCSLTSFFKHVVETSNSQQQLIIFLIQGRKLLKSRQLGFGNLSDTGVDSFDE